MVDFDGILSSDSKVCKPCYEFHRWVLQQHNPHQSTSALTLNDIVALLEWKIVQLKGSKNELISDREYIIGWVVCKVTLKLVKTLHQDEAMLLPEVHSHFCHVVSTNIQNFPNVQKSLKTSLLANQWLLSSISNYLQDNIGILCKHKRYSALLYRKMATYWKRFPKLLGMHTGLYSSECNNQYTKQESCANVPKRSLALRVLWLRFNASTTWSPADPMYANLDKTCTGQVTAL